MQSTGLAPAFFATLALLNLAAAPIDDAMRSVVQVETNGGLGTGFVVGTGDTIATNFHVVENAKEVSCVLPNGARVAVAGFLYAEPKFDLVLLRTTKSTDLKPLPLSSAPREVGAEVFALGSPQGLQGSASKGIISANRRWSDLKPLLSDGLTAFGYAMDGQWIQTDAAINSGNSGGPLILANGEVVGVSTLSTPPDVGQSLGFAVDASHLANAIRMAAVQPRSVADLPKADRGAFPTAKGDVTAAATEAYWNEVAQIFVDKNLAMANVLPEFWRLGSRNDPQPMDDTSKDRILDRLQPISEVLLRASEKLQVLDSHNVDPQLVNHTSTLAAMIDASAFNLGKLSSLRNSMKVLREQLIRDRARSRINPYGAEQAEQLLAEWEERWKLVDRIEGHLRHVQVVASEKLRQSLDRRYSLKLPKITPEQSAKDAAPILQEQQNRQANESAARAVWNRYLTATQHGYSGEKSLRELVEKFPDTTYGKRASSILTEKQPVPKPTQP